MSNLFAKARAFTLGNMHELLDKAIDLNSPAVLKQYVRDLETAISQLKVEAATQGGLLRTLNREIGDLQNNINSKTAAIHVRLVSLPKPVNSEGQVGTSVQDPTVRSWGAQVVAWNKELESKKAELPIQQKVVADLDAAVAKLDAKHTEAVSNVRNLESRAHVTEAKNRSVRALEQSANLTSSVDAGSIDNLQAKVRAAADVADEKFDRAMGSEAFAESAEQSADVDNFLATLK
jgi:phage shock protein A